MNPRGVNSFKEICDMDLISDGIKILAVSIVLGKLLMFLGGKVHVFGLIQSHMKSLFNFLYHKRTK